MVSLCISNLIALLFSLLEIFYTEGNLFLVARAGEILAFLGKDSVLESLLV